MDIRPVRFENNELYLIDQRILPLEYKDFKCLTYKDVIFAIKDMVVRGAPAIGGAAAYGIVLAANEFKSLNGDEFLFKMRTACDEMNEARPTAVNLMWAVRRMRTIINELKHSTNEEIHIKLSEEAKSIEKEDVENNMAIGTYGNEIVPSGATILTHCNAGALATMGYGTALGVIRKAHSSGKNVFVYSDETRPRLQGARLTAWELMKENIPCKTIFDSVAATLMRDGKIDLIIVGADRIARNGDTANKIGTFMLSVIAKVYNVPFYVAAPLSTFDFNIETGEQIKIEERDIDEITVINGIRISPEGMDAYNPGFDVTPFENITGLITEKGIIKPPFKENICKLRIEN